MPTRADKRPAIRTVRGWAIALLVEVRAIEECPDHGHWRDRGDPHALSRAHQIARLHPFPGTSARSARAAIDDIMISVGDTCPDCGDVACGAETRRQRPRAAR